MKANELRIGNLVLDNNNEIHEICYNCFQRFRYPSMDGNSSGFKPIPLTEEWLVKFGFNPDNNKIVYDHPSPKEPENEHKDLGTQYPAFFYNKRLNRWMDCHTRVCVDYVHSLQNLYFALTGEELTIKNH